MQNNNKKVENKLVSRIHLKMRGWKSRRRNASLALAAGFRCKINSNILLHHQFLLFLCAPVNRRRRIIQMSKSYAPTSNVI